MEMDIGNAKTYLPLDLEDIKGYVESGLNALSSNLEMMYGASGVYADTKLNISELKNVDYINMMPGIISKPIASDNSVPFIVIFKKGFIREVLNVVTGNLNGGNSEEFDEFDLSTCSEVLSQVYNTFGSGLSLAIGKPVDAFSSETVVFNNYGDLISSIKIGSDDQVLTIHTKLGFEGFSTNEILIIASTKVINEFQMARYGRTMQSAPVMEEKVQPQIDPTPNENSKAVIKTDNSDVDLTRNTINENYNVESHGNPLLMQPLTSNNLDLLMNVPLDISIEIGRTHKKIHEILDFTNGTVIELNKPVSEPVDMYANNKMIAHGEVVVIEDNFGMKVSEVLDIKKVLAAIAGDD